MRATFTLGRPLGEIAQLLVGLRTGDNDRFLRRWWEVAANRMALHCRSLEEATASRARWFPYNKGGEFRKWYGNHEYVVNWEGDGFEVETELARRYPYLLTKGNNVVRGQGRDRYFSPSVSWSDVTSGAPSFRHYPAGFIHGNKGNSIFAADLVLERLATVLNSPCSMRMIEALAPTMTSSVGDIAKIPIPDVSAEPRMVSNLLVANAQLDWDESETSWNFEGNPLVLLTE